MNMQLIPVIYRHRNVLFENMYMKVFEQRKCKGLVYLISIDAAIIFCYKNACINE